jgi:hypothetical protein
MLGHMLKQHDAFFHAPQSDLVHGSASCRRAVARAAVSGFGRGRG